MRGPIITVDTDYTMTAGDFCVRVDADATITLPPASGGPQIVLVVETSAVINVVVTPGGADTVGWSTGPSSNGGLYISDGVTNWFN